MTNRTVDIHCAGCGTYYHSLSPHMPTREILEDRYCAVCAKEIARGVWSGVMLSHLWYKDTCFKIERYTAQAKLSIRRNVTLTTFAWKMQGENISRNILSSPPPIMIPALWKAITEEKFAGFEQHCASGQMSLIRAFIKFASQA